MFSSFFRPSGTLLNVFENQFCEENGVLVYRRYGKGQAYRTNDAQREELVEHYVRDYRRNYILTVALTLLAFGCFIPVILSGVEPEGVAFWTPVTALFAAIIAWFTWANHRAVTRPERILAREVPVSSALSSEEAKRKALSQISYGGLALAPCFGLLFVFLMSDEFDVWSGYGRAVWLMPIGFTILAGVQAIRKFQTERNEGAS